MKDNWIAKLDVLIVAFSLFAALPLARAAFDDVDLSHLNVDAIHFVQREGVVSGYPDGTYQPDRMINRAEFTKIVIESQFNETEITECETTDFPDVSKNVWFSSYVCLAQKNGVIQGYPDGTFRPAQNISFVEASKIIVNTFNYPVEDDIIWYKPFVEELGKRRAIPFSVDRFEKNITRGEMAEMIYRLLANVNDKTSKTYAMLDPTSEGFGAPLNLRSSRPIQVTDGQKHSIPLEAILGGGPPKDGIPSIDAPKFVTVPEANLFLDDEGLGVALSLNGLDRFYPNQILVWHEIVNDSFNGTPALITYCPLCGTGIVFDPTIDGDPSGFGTSGKLWNSNLVMYDWDTDSYWSQVLGEAVVGERTGIKLRILPYDNLLYKDWKKDHPNGQVLSTDTGENRDYTRDPYGSYYTNESLYFPVDFEDDRYHKKEPVFGLELNGKYRAYPQEELEAGEASFADQLAGIDLTVTWNAANKTIEVRRIDNGKEVVPTYGFWFSWVSVHPETEVYTAK